MVCVIPGPSLLPSSSSRLFTTTSVKPHLKRLLKKITQHKWLCCFPLGAAHELQQQTGSPHPEDSRTGDTTSHHTTQTQSTQLSRRRWTVDVRCPLRTANIALTWAEQMDLRSFYQHELGPERRTRGPEAPPAARHPPGALGLGVKSWCSWVVRL